MLCRASCSPVGDLNPTAECLHSTYAGGHWSTHPAAKLSSSCAYELTLHIALHHCVAEHQCVALVVVAPARCAQATSQASCRRQTSAVMVVSRRRQVLLWAGIQYRSILASAVRTPHASGAQWYVYSCPALAVDDMLLLQGFMLITCNRMAVHE